MVAARIIVGLHALVFAASAVRKAKDLQSAEGHFLMGVGKLYPGWMLPIAFAHESTILGLLYVDRPMAMVASAAFIGGICHAQSTPIGPWAKLGPKLLIPVAIVILTTVALALTAADSAGPISRRLALDRLSSIGLLLTGLATGAAGATFAAALAAANK